MREQLISVIIAERPYRLSIRSEKEEEVFRFAARLIEEKMKEYGSNYAYRDKQDLLAMVSLQFAVEVLRLENISQLQSELKENLEKIDRTLDENLLNKS
jgi:cell division protein ZapA (FtsZ GTPase activity inhibitor)